ncbi:AraC family transcriptional regulator [Nocardiopsis sp. RV163]|uniref:helix-turn-helix domain-containing protein n=1 Tax=Nocardiopsis sp. RV163 TaxID=1661388 RepID=UPI000B32C1EC|nr:AraC family transcriptional regulator [Nocardiopsis sp. RV163]
MEKSVRQAVTFIHNRYYEPITLNEIAAAVFVSPYHFSRVFSRAVGLTPGRYLTAVRLFAAKRMLLTTDLTVSDIVCSVGYNSVGTFTSRFTRAVGVSPTQYRHPVVSRLLVAASHGFSRLPDLEEMVGVERERTPLGPYTHAVRGVLDIPESVGRTEVMVGVFADALPQGTPVAFTALRARGRTEFEVVGVPGGHHRVIAVAMPQGARSGAVPTLTASTPGHIKVTGGLGTYVCLPMEPVKETDPPVAVTLADTSTIVGAKGLRVQRLRQTVVA